MGVMFNKGKNFSVLQGFNVPKSSLDYLLDIGASFLLGDNAIGLACGTLKKELVFKGLGLNNALKNPTPSDTVLVITFVTEFIAAAKMASAAKVETIPIPKEDVDSLPICKLRDATMMYQRVNGTSGSSVYRVVAFNDKVKVAARVTDSKVSIRVEGEFTPGIENAFYSVGMTKKSDEYLSGHYGCDNCTPSKLIGSVLVGSGVEFKSPLPHFEKVCK